MSVLSSCSMSARLMVRPFRGYAALAAAPDAERPSVIAGMVRLLFVVGAFVSVTATGRFAPFELVSGMVSFAYVPVLHFVAVAVAVRAVAPSVNARHAYALYAEGYGPWFLSLLVVAGGALFFARPAHLPTTGSALFLGTFFWGGVLTYACFRAGLVLSRGRAAAALAIHYFVLTALVVGYYTAAGQLLPILAW